MGSPSRVGWELVDACRLSPPSFSFLRQTERPVVQLRGRRPNVPKTAEGEEEGGYKRLMLKARPEKRSREKARARGRSFREDFI